MTIAIFGSLYQDQYIARVAALLDKARRLGLDIAVECAFDEYLTEQGVEMPSPRTIIDSTPFDADMAISLGGDGTFLRTAQWVGAKEIPILGVNTGHLGYLAAVTIDDAPAMLGDIVRGHYALERRSLIEVVGADLTSSGLWPYALNEVAVLKEDTASMISVDAEINTTPLATYLADGLLVATPTGSTGYNLSVGGPIVEPTAPNWLITPIAAHSLTMRPLVVSDGSVVKLTTTSRVNDYRVSLDGRSVTLPVGSSITLRRAPFSTVVVHPVGHSFATTLRQKLLWGQPLYS